MPSQILLVSSSAEAAEVIVRFLLREGYDVSAVFSKKEAEEKIQHLSPDLVLIDISLPNGDGNLLCMDIKANEKTALIPVIVTIGLDDPELRSQALMAGADEVFIKPFDQGRLRDRIRPLLRTKLLTDRLLRVQQTENKRVFVEDEPIPQSPHTVERVFTFPEEVKIPCEQYLLYFVEFLRDIGIEANANLQDIAGRILFSVTPKDKDEALDNIREALNLYLGLVGSRTAMVPVSAEQDIEVQKLSAQLHHLHSQLHLAGAVLQQKDNSLQQQQILIQQQAEFAKVVLQALQKGNEESEHLIGDVIKVKKWSIDNIPIELDLPEIIRRCRDVLRRRRLP